MHWDAEVGVVGGGPAGARAAELLAALGVDVVLWDPRAPWEKPCGGGLTAALVQEFPELEETREFARPVREASLDTPAGDCFTLQLESPIWMVSRQDLARWQLDRACASGASVRTSGVRSIERAPDGEGWLLSCGERGESGDSGGSRTDPDGERVAVRFLVGADGAASLVRRVAFPGFRPARLATRVQYPLGPGGEPGRLHLRFFPDLLGYLWEFPRRDHRSIGIAVVPDGVKRQRLDWEVERYYAGKNAGGGRDAQRAGATIATAGRSHGDYSCVGSRDVALVGDAAGFADPATGEGIHYALRSATLLAEAFGSAGDFSRYPSLVRDAFEDEFRRSRLLFRALFRGDRLACAVRLGHRSAVARALLGALLDGTNRHDLSPIGVARRWFGNLLPRSPRTA